MYTKGQMVYPDKRKGLVYLYQADDSLMHICWKDRGTGTVEEVGHLHQLKGKAVLSSEYKCLVTIVTIVKQKYCRWLSNC